MSRWHRSRLFELHRRFLQHHETSRTHQANNCAICAHKRTRTIHPLARETQPHLKDSAAGSEKVGRRGGWGKGGVGGQKTWSVGSRECKPNSGKRSCDCLVCVSTTSHVNARDLQDGVKGNFCHFFEIVCSRRCCVGSNSGSHRLSPSDLDRFHRPGLQFLLKPNSWQREKNKTKSRSF